ncbi:hypothetical protein ACWJKU_13805 [Methylocaldum sp. MU1018]
MNKSFAMLGLITMTLSSCATTPSSKVGAIKDTDYYLLSTTECKFVGSVSGTSGWGSWENIASVIVPASARINHAKNEAKEQAVRLGATHIMWLSVTGASSPNVTGEAYKCR